MSDQNCNDSNCQPCGLYPFERVRYFDGQLLTAADLQAEQHHLTGKHRLHNHRLHGVGTVCGLKVKQHPNPACHHRYVVLEPGMAMDCCGNELIVADEEVIDMQEAIRDAFQRIHRRGKARGIMTVAVDQAHEYRAMGADFMAIGTDVNCLVRSIDGLRRTFLGLPGTTDQKGGGY